jgi:hypothetical protein
MRGYKITVTDAPTLLVAADNLNRTIYVHVVGNSAIALGNASVTFATGVLTEKHTTPFEILLPLGETIYAICDNGTVDVRVLAPNAD